MKKWWGIRHVRGALRAFDYYMVYYPDRVNEYARQYLDGVWAGKY